MSWLCEESEWKHKIISKDLVCVVVFRRRLPSSSSVAVFCRRLSSSSSLAFRLRMCRVSRVVFSRVVSPSSSVRVCVAPTPRHDAAPRRRGARRRARTRRAVARPPSHRVRSARSVRAASLSRRLGSRAAPSEWIRRGAPDARTRALTPPRHPPPRRLVLASRPPAPARLVLVLAPRLVGSRPPRARLQCPPTPAAPRRRRRRRRSSRRPIWTTTTNEPTRVAAPTRLATPLVR